jgi:hypothetical protein
MDVKRLSCILPVSNADTDFSSTIASVLALDDCAAEIFIVTNGYAAIAESVAPHIERSNVDVIEIPGSSTALDDRAAGLECAHADWVVFLDAGYALESNAYVLAQSAAEATGADFVAQAEDGTSELQAFDGPAIATTLFDRNDPALSGVFMKRALAETAFDQLPAMDVAKDSDIAILFSAALAAQRLAVLPEPLLAKRPEEPEARNLDVRRFTELCASAQATASAARLLSQTDGWDENREAYEELSHAVLGKLLKLFPYSVRKQDRPACFDVLAKSWQAPELVSAIMKWRGDTLLPFMEAIQSASVFTHADSSKIERVAILAPQRSVLDPETLAGVETAFRELGIIPKLFTDDRSAYPDIFNTCLQLASYDAGQDYFDRGRELSAALLEHGIDAVVAPLSADPAQAPDLMLCRLLDVSVALFAPEHPVQQIPHATMPGLMRQAQMADVITVPARKNATFWSMASHARIVVEDEADDSAEFISRVLDELEKPSSAPRTTYRPDLSFGPLGIAPKKPRQPEPTDAEKQLEELKRQMELLQARLAGAENEAETLRRQLAETERNGTQSDA